MNAAPYLMRPGRVPGTMIPLTSQTGHITPYDEMNPLDQIVDGEPINILKLDSQGKFNNDDTHYKSNGNLTE